MNVMQMQVPGQRSHNRPGKRRVWMVAVAALFCLALNDHAGAQTWTTMAEGKAPTFNVGVALQLTDGRILIQQFNTSNWYTLTPNKFGVYHEGTFAKVASFPKSMNYAPEYFASAVLPDGRVIVEGGEFNNGVNDWTNKGAIYNPVTNIWTPVPAPKGWTQIGDASSVVLPPNGTFMMANINNGQSALLDANTLVWTIVPGKGKNDVNDEEGWTLLPNGDVLTVDTYVGYPPTYAGRNSEIYNPAGEIWGSAGDTKVRLWDSHVSCPTQTGGPANEMGPALLTPNDQVIAFGANTCTGKAGHVSMYAIPFGVWVPGPDIPNGDDMADAPAALLPSGNILIETNKGYGQTPAKFYEFVNGGLGYDPVPAPPGYSGNSEGGRMLVMPDASILLTHEQSKNLWFYNGIEGDAYSSSWQPTICYKCYPTTVTVGDSYKISGTQFNGLSQGAAFGDDAQSATNFPLVRIKNKQSGEVHYARTYNFSTGVATGTKIVSTEFKVLPGTPTGASTLVVVANGIPSEPVDITVN